MLFRLCRFRLTLLQVASCCQDGPVAGVHNSYYLNIVLSATVVCSIGIHPQDGRLTRIPHTILCGKFVER